MDLKKGFVLNVERRESYVICRFKMLSVLFASSILQRIDRGQIEEVCCRNSESIGVGSVDVNQNLSLSEF